MIGDALRVEIERYAKDMRRSNPIFSKAEDGTLTREMIAAYLESIRQLVCQTPVCLAEARSRARELGDKALASHYAEKLGEEEGHDEWAERDIERVSEISVTAKAVDAMPAIVDLIGYLHQVIEEDPARYLAYILFAEYITVLMGPAWLQLLEERCGIPRSAMSVVGNHVELDKDHVEEALDRIDDLVGDPKKLPLMREVLNQAIAYFERFCAEVTDEERIHAALRARSKPVVAA